MGDPRLLGRRCVRLLPVLGAAFLLSIGRAHARASKLNPRLRSLKSRLAVQASGYGVAGAGAGAQAAEPSFRLLLRAAPGVTKAQLAARYPSARFGSQTGRIITAAVPPSVLEAFEGDPDIESAESSRALKPAMDVVRSSTTSGGLILGSLDPAFINFGTNFGSGVVVGLVDSGIDWKHLDFRDDVDPNISRILFLWDQNIPSGSCGSATGVPAGYADGCEFTQAEITTEIMFSPGVVTSSDTDGHGTHVAGIAAGDGSATLGVYPPGTYAGIAKLADFIVVKTTFSEDAILDGVNYIIQKAQSLGKRAVINLSLSGQDGPHDGTSAFGSALATIAQSTPVVAAMGNDHGLDGHASAIVPLAGSRTFEYVRFDSSSFLTVDFWGVAGDTYTITVTTVSGGGTVLSALPDQYSSATIQGADIEIYNNAPSSLNGDPQGFIAITAPGIIPPDHFFITFTRAGLSTASGLMEGWVFDTLQAKFTGAKVDPASTLGSPAVVDEVISVGSYCHKRRWIDSTLTLQTDVNCTAGTLGDISNFSGRGPNRKGTIKPEVSAPGELTASSWSVDKSTPPTTANQIQDGFRRMARGTSMAAPVVTGIVALMLERNPGYTVAQIKAELAASARSDAKVAAAGAPPNNTFGEGKATVFGCGVPVSDPPSPAVGTTLGISSISWNWSLAANATSYHLYYATATGTFITDIPAPPYVQLGLAPDTTQQLTIGGANACGEGPKAPAIATATFAEAVSVFNFTTEISSITLSFTPTVNSGYRFEASQSAGYLPPLVSSATTESSVGVLRLDGLQALATYYLRIAALNRLGSEIFTIVGQTVTLTSLVNPSTGAITAGTDSQLQPTWTLNGNPPNLEYYVDGSTASDFSGTLLSSHTFNLSALFTGLSPNTSYHFRVRAATGPWTYGIFDATSTLAVMPIAATPQFLPVYPTSATALWVDGGNPPGVRFIADISSDAAFGSGIVSSNTANTFLDLSGLDTNTTYYGRVTALSLLGTPSAWLNIATMTMTNAPGPPSISTFSSVTSSVTVNWGPLPLAPSSASCFGYRVETSTAADFSGFLLRQTIFNPAASALSISGLAALTTYYFRVGAINRHFRANFRVLGSTLTKTVILSSGVVNNGPLVISATPAYSVLPFVEVTVPNGALSNGTVVSINASVPFLFDPALSNQANLTPLGAGVGVNIDAQGAQPNQPVRIQMNYNPAFLPPGFSEEQIVVANFRDGVWSILPTSVDRINQRVFAQTRHFSLFAPFFAAPASVLDAVQIFPIPWKIASGDMAFDAVRLSFTNLPVDGEIRLYTILGEKVRTLKADAAGLAFWDGKNHNGFKVGSGTYLAVITGGGGRKIRRVVIVR